MFTGLSCMAGKAGYLGKLLVDSWLRGTKNVC